VGASLRGVAAAPGMKLKKLHIELGLHIAAAWCCQDPCPSHSLDVEGLARTAVLTDSGAGRLRSSDGADQENPLR
jgi:hypothetical protein